MKVLRGFRLHPKWKQQKTAPLARSILNERIMWLRNYMVSPSGIIASWGFPFLFGCADRVENGGGPEGSNKHSDPTSFVLRSTSRRGNNLRG